MLQSLNVTVCAMGSHWSTLSKGVMWPDLGWIEHSGFYMERGSQGTQSRRRKLFTSYHQFSRVPTWGDGAHGAATNIEENHGEKLWEGGEVNSEAPMGHPRPPCCTTLFNVNGSPAEQKHKGTRWTGPLDVVQHVSPGIVSYHWVDILVKGGRWEASKVLSNDAQYYEENQLSTM